MIDSREMYPLINLDFASTRDIRTSLNFSFHILISDDRFSFSFLILISILDLNLNF